MAAALNHAALDLTPITSCTNWSEGTRLLLVTWRWQQPVGTTLMITLTLSWWQLLTMQQNAAAVAWHAGFLRATAIQLTTSVMDDNRHLTLASMQDDVRQWHPEFMHLAPNPLSRVCLKQRLARSLLSPFCQCCCACSSCLRTSSLPNQQGLGVRSALVMHMVGHRYACKSWEERCGDLLYVTEPFWLYQATYHVVDQHEVPAIGKAQQT